MNFARDRFALAVAILVAAASLVACGGENASPSTFGGGSGAVSATSSLASGPPPTSVGEPPSPTPPDETAPLTIDPALLAYFPATVADIPLIEDVDEAALALTDPVLPQIATAVDAAAAVDTGTGNLVFAWIVQLKPGVFTDPNYRQWRDAYDNGACAAAGEVVGRAEAEIGGRTAYVTSCAAGLHTYHVWIEDQDLLVSASAIGAGRFGELLLAGLRIPAGASPSPGSPT